MSIQEIPNSYRRIENSPKTSENELIEKDQSIESWEVRLKELCLSGDYPLIHELISQLLIDKKREWIEEKRKEVIKIIDLYGAAAFTLDAEIARHIVLLLEK